MRVLASWGAFRQKWSCPVEQKPAGYKEVASGGCRCTRKTPVRCVAGCKSSVEWRVW